METRLRAWFCPCCGANLKPPRGRTWACEYCDAVLFSDGPEEVVGSAPPSASPDDREQPPARLFQRSGERFEMTALLQEVEPAAASELFTCLELTGDRFALVYLRLDGPLPLAAIEESLQAYSDPGLAANRALEWLAAQPQGFSGKLECMIALFDPALAKVTPFLAGCGDSLWWLSCEEGRTTQAGRHNSPLERKMLRSLGDQFQNGEDIYLASQDLIVGTSAAVRQVGWSFVEALNENLGEDPLRVVTLAKNAFWKESRQKPGSNVQLVAVRAMAPPQAEWQAPPRILEFGTARYEMACWASEDDWLELCPLHDQRFVLIWIGNDGMAIDPALRDRVRSRIVEVLDRPQHGDNENPRAAGRYALEGTSLPRLAVVQLFDRWNRVKYYRFGWSQPIALGDRGKAYDVSIQAFDEGGEATVGPGGRLFFPGQCPLSGFQIPECATAWPGGKTSWLYQEMLDHWRTPPTRVALERLARAVRSDRPSQPLEGLALVTGKR